MEQEEKTISSFYMNCECMGACGSLRITQDKDGITYISYNVPAYRAYQENEWDKLKKALKSIWLIVTGKQYRLYELVIMDNATLQRFRMFAEALKDIDEGAEEINHE